MITLITGQIGDGKTLYALTLAIALRAEGRPVYAIGIRGLNEEASGIKVWGKEFSDWEEMEPNAVMVVDEVQDLMPAGGSVASIPEWWKRLAKSRHSGVDFIWITQDPMNLHPFPRRLVNKHFHVSRKDGDVEVATVFERKGVETDLDRIHKTATGTLWRYPKQNYALYKSAERHTHKKHVPTYIKRAGALVVFALVCAGGGYWAVNSMLPEEATAEAPAEGAPVASRSPLEVKAVSETKWSVAAHVHRFTPRIPGLPYTAPAYEGLQPGPPPRIACMSSDDSCTCLTIDQGTRYTVAEEICRALALHGAYDPFLSGNGSVSQSPPPEAGGVRSIFGIGGGQ